jgi:hypothetical protein
LDWNEGLAPGDRKSGSQGPVDHPGGAINQDPIPQNQDAQRTGRLVEALDSLRFPAIAGYADAAAGLAKRLADAADSSDRNQAFILARGVTGAVKAALEIIADLGAEARP